MSETIACTAKEAIELLKHIDDDSLVILMMLNERTGVSNSKRIPKKNGEILIEKAGEIYYQDNDFFGWLSLRKVPGDLDLIHNIMFPQIE